MSQRTVSGTYWDSDAASTELDRPTQPPTSAPDPSLPREYSQNPSHHPHNTPSIPDEGMTDLSLLLERCSNLSPRDPAPDPAAGRLRNESTRNRPLRLSAPEVEIARELKQEMYREGVQWEGSPANSDGSNGSNSSGDDDDDDDDDINALELDTHSPASLPAPPVRDFLLAPQRTDSYAPSPPTSSRFTASLDSRPYPYVAGTPPRPRTPERKTRPFWQMVSSRAR